jgi:predicted Zn finger-like uncharacterized protein
MSTIVTCPGCHTAYNLPNESLGKRVRCRNCQQSFPTSPGDAAAKEGRLEVEAVDEPDLVDDSLQAEERPVKSAIARRIRDDEDDDRSSFDRRGDDEDEDADDAPPPKQKSALPAILMIVGGVLLLLFLVCGGVFGFVYYQVRKTASRITEENQARLDELEELQKKEQEQFQNNPQNPFNPGPGFGPGPGERQPQKRPGEYANLNEALEDAKPGDVWRAKAACEWIAKAKIEDNRRAEVISKMEPLLTEHVIKESAAQAIEAWAAKDNVPLLITMLRSDSGGVKKSAMNALVRLKDERAAAPLAEKLKNFFERGDASQALRNLGPIAEKEVVKYAFDPDGGVQGEARKLLTGYGTKNSVYVSQALEELKRGDNDHQWQAVAWIEKAPLEETLQADVAKALEPLLVDNDTRARYPAVRALKTWATKDSIPPIVRLLDHQDGQTRKLAMGTLGKLKDERSVVPIALRLIDFFDRETASNTLQAMGPIVEVPEVINGLANKDAAIRIEVCRILAASGTSKSLKPLNNLLKVEKDRNVALAAASAIKMIEDRDKAGK